MLASASALTCMAFRWTLKVILIPLTPQLPWCQRGFRDTLGFVGIVWRAFGEKTNRLLKQSMTCLPSPFALPRSRLEIACFRRERRSARSKASVRLGVSTATWWSRLLRAFLSPHEIPFPLEHVRFHKWTQRHISGMSAFPAKADIKWCARIVL